MTGAGYRLAKWTRAQQAFDGLGAQRTGGRWNSPGVRLVYAAENLSLAQLEVLVHFERTSALGRYALIVARFPASLVLRMEDQFATPADWASRPPSRSTQLIGDRWVRDQASAILSVPTVISPGERNLLFNPLHPDFSQVVLDPPVRFQFDGRLAPAL
ncbi:MAG TPA: RES family NAD+ phosphorylase [Verrucomicrobiota bacterium]|nr:RES family NAD+ phosphorylase [Verrucomicrobiota bacterium]